MVYNKLRDLFMPQAKSLTREEKEKRANELAKRLRSGGFVGDHRVTIPCYIDWKKSNFTAWPFPGGRLAQPSWVLSDFSFLEDAEEYFRLRAELVKVTTAPELKPSG